MALGYVLLIGGLVGVALDRYIDYPPGAYWRFTQTYMRIAAWGMLLSGMSILFVAGMRIVA